MMRIQLHRIKPCREQQSSLAREKRAGDTLRRRLQVAAALTALAAACASLATAIVKLMEVLGAR